MNDMLQPPMGGQAMPPSFPTGADLYPQEPEMPQNVAEDVVSPEQKQVLLDMISKIRAKLSSLEATQVASSGKVDAIRQDLLRQVFEKLQMAGVDLTSRESVSAFIMRLQEQNPELAEMFEKSMDVLLGTPAGQSFGSAEDPNAMPPEQIMQQEEQIPQGMPPQIG